MMYCNKCGKRLEGNERFCPGCGNSIYGELSGQVNNDNGSFGWAILGFFWPIVGIILYLCWKDTKPYNGKKALWGAVTSIIASLVLVVIVFILLSIFAVNLY